MSLSSWRQRAAGGRRRAPTPQARCRWLWACCFAAAAPALAGAVEAEADGVGALPAIEYLSREAFPGLHVLERVGEGPRWRLHRMGQSPEAAGREPIEADVSAWGSWQDARRELERLLRIPPREPLQQPWNVFDAQGRRLQSLAELKAQPVAFVLEIGQWMWPAVRIGFEHRAVSVNRDTSATLRALSLRPVVFEVRDFITKSETEELMQIGGKQGLHTSKGVLQSDDIKKKTKHAQFRTSKQAWLDNSLAPVVALLDGRVANLTRVPAAHNEPVQLLRYNEGQYYHGHMDWTELELYKDQRSIWHNSHFGHQDRLATVFWYLNDVQEGGETIFPKHGQPICGIESKGGLESRHCPGARDPDMASCEQGLKVPPRRGSVILWYNYHANGRGDRNALHAGCPVGKGLTKWSANKWVRMKSTDSPASWVEGHPAMKRHGWVDPNGPKTTPDPMACQIVFTNNADESVDLMWEDNSGGYQKLASIAPGHSLSQNSYKGHVFRLTSRSQHSNKVECTGSHMDFELTAKFRLRRGKPASQDL